MKIRLKNKEVEMKSMHELSKIPFIKCECGVDFRPLRDTYINGKPYCAKCKFKALKSTRKK